MDDRSNLASFLLEAKRRANLLTPEDRADLSRRLVFVGGSPGAGVAVFSAPMGPEEWLRKWTDPVYLERLRRECREYANSIRPGLGDLLDRPSAASPWEGRRASEPDLPDPEAADPGPTEYPGGLTAERPPEPATTTRGKWKFLRAITRG